MRCGTSHRFVLLCALLGASLVAAAAEDAGILIYTLPGTAVKPGLEDTEVVLSVEIDKAVVATQTVRVPPEDPPRDRMIEVLAGQPEARADVERKLRGGGDNAAVVVRVGGKQYQRLTWKELVAASAAAISVEPAALSAAVIQALTPAQQQCSDACTAEYDVCIRTCEPYSGPNACWDCPVQLQACSNFCLNCPRRWTTYGPWKETFRQSTGLVLCLADQASQSLRAHKEYLQTYTRTVTEFTENCDHSISQRTSTQTRYENCWTQLGYFCNRFEGYFGNRKKCP